MTSSDYSLAFLTGLRHCCTEQDVEDTWHDRVFPLVCTDDFARNWTVTLDPNGLFISSLGERCRVDAQPHHEKNCRVTTYDNGIAQEEKITYESIIFAKVVFRLSLIKKSWR